MEKAYLMPVGGSDKIKVLFNPSQYVLNRTNNIVEVPVPGLGTPIIQYMSGKASTLKFDLFFDSYEAWPEAGIEAGSDISKVTNKVYDLLKVDGTKHVPPVVEFGWASFKFKCVLDSIDGTFTMFKADGTPLRATLKVTLREIVDVDVTVRDASNESTDRVKTWTVKRGDTLSGIASAEYNDPGQWRPIAEANGIDDPLSIQPGDVLVLPALTGSAG
jgi:LysM repeat protein